MKQILAITRKELRGYFGSPMALIFLGAFLAATLFSFFWLDAFFARGIADVRPLFSRMPILLIFLVAALTMRQWSEEQRSGTLEILLTLPVRPVQLVLGKFLAVLALVALALALTLFLPLTVALLGPLDWGPVFGGYLAALLLAAAYTAIGLFISSRTDNQIVALIATALLGGLFYIVGTAGVTDFAGEKVGTVLRAIGAGSRFESIQRGVIDLRDLIYYLTLAGIFLTLNVLSLLSQRWSTGEQTRPQREGATTLSLLVALNLIVTNVWLYPLRALRVDLTQQHEYSLSTTTRDLLNGLQEPLLIRGYFSEKTHPLLAPLVPQVRDMLEEYRIASGGKVQVEIVDPAQDAEKEAEANQTYGISPTPFQVSGRYEASVINSYFDILLRYGDQHIVLNFQDLIEVQYNRDGTLDVHLRNLEYDLTRSIKKIVYGFQSVDAVLAALPEPAQLTLYVTSNTLPEQLAGIPETVQKVANDLATQSNGKFTFQQVDPDAPNSPVSRQQIYERYGLQAIPVSLFSDESFYLDMALKVGEKEEIVSVSGYTEADIRTAIESALKRAAPGFLKVIGLWTPPATPTQDMFGQLQQPLASWDQLNKALSEEYEVQSVDLSSGQVPPNVNVLVLVAPQGLGEKELYAVDQYLMRGGAVIVATSNSKLSVNQYTGSLTMEPLDGTLDELLAHYGVTVQPLLVLDQQNAPFPMQVRRTVNGVQVQEIQPLDYPFFVDIRSANMAAGNPIVSNLTAVTLNWAAPLTVDPTRTAGREVTPLLNSSARAWTQSAASIEPNFDLYPDTGFPVITATQTYSLAVALQGTFESYYKGKPSPLISETLALTATTGAQTPVAGTLESSAGNARLVVIGSSEFVDDIVLNLSSRLSGERVQNNLKLMQNAVAWATEDTDLLTIRARGTISRGLYSLSEGTQSFVEGANYVLALAALAVVGIVSAVRRRNEKPMELVREEIRE